MDINACLYRCSIEEVEALALNPVQLLCKLLECHHKLQPPVTIELKQHLSDRVSTRKHFNGPPVSTKCNDMAWFRKKQITSLCASIPVVSLSEPASYIQNRKWLCSQVWVHRCWPDRRLQWYSHWWGSHSYQRQLDDKIKHIWYSEWLRSIRMLHLCLQK